MFEINVKVCNIQNNWLLYILRMYKKTDKKHNKIINYINIIKTTSTTITSKAANFLKF